MRSCEAKRTGARRGVSAKGEFQSLFYALEGGGHELMRCGRFDPHLKAGASFYATLPLPAELIEDASRNNGTDVAGSDGEQQEVIHDAKRRKSVTWIVEVVSQVIFSANASVSFEVLLGDEENCLNTGYGFGSGSASPRPGSAGSSDSGALHKALHVRLQGTKDLWDIPAFPSWDDEGEVQCELDPEEQDEERERNKEKKRKRKTKKVHLVIVTHGLHSNTGADMLFMKEAIDEEYRKGEIAAKEKAAREGTEFNEDDREMVIVRGFHGNVCRTERGIKFLGRRLAKYILNLVNPSSPPPSPLPHKLQKPRKPHHHPHLAVPPLEDIPPYEITSISFVGHSLGGLVQTYAIAYIHAYVPEFFTLHKPINFVALATPFLGLSNENPIYVRFALDFGLVGRTGQDLGLTWRSPFPLPAFAKPSNSSEADTSKPLLRILPTGPAHDVLRMFRNRTVYANVVNDGIVPLRTSCLLFLDWKGLGKVEKARRENGSVGGLVGWGWGQLTNGTGRGVSPRTSMYGAGSSAGSSPTIPWFNSGTRKLEEKVEENPVTEAPKTGEPTKREIESRVSTNSQTSSESSATTSSVPNPFTSILTLFRPQAAKRKGKEKDAPKIYRRSQTIDLESDSRPGSVTPEPPEPPSPNLSIPPNLLAPPRTSILEAAGDVLNPPLPSPAFILNPHSRPRTIFHDRIYSAADIPPPSQANPMKVEEKIARAYHAGLSWRKVLVRLEPDAHNNLVVRRMFANAYGWPVVQHLTETHFGASHAATTDDALETHQDQADVAGDEDLEVDSASPIKRRNRSSTESSAQWSDRAFLVSDDEDEPSQTEELSAFLNPPAATAHSARAHKTPCPAEVAKVAVLASPTEEPGGLGILGVNGGVGLASSDAVRMLRGSVQEGVVERVARLGFKD